MPLFIFLFLYMLYINGVNHLGGRGGQLKSNNTLLGRAIQKGTKLHVIIKVQLLIAFYLVIYSWFIKSG